MSTTEPKDRKENQPRALDHKQLGTAGLVSALCWSECPCAGSNALLQQHSPCAEPTPGSVSGLPRSPLLPGGLPGADQLLCRVLPSSGVPVLSLPRAPGAGSALQRRFDLEEAELGNTNSSHTRHFLMCSEAENELGFEISSPKSQSRTPGTSPRRRVKGMCAATPLKLQRRVTELQSQVEQEPSGLEFIMWTHPLGQQQRWVKPDQGHAAPGEGRGQGLVPAGTAFPGKNSPSLPWNDKHLAILSRFPLPCHFRFSSDLKSLNQT